MRVQFKPLPAIIGATLSVVAGVLIFHTPIPAVIVISVLIGIMCGLINWEN